ncbi:plasmid pRiA4b ORF-3 family protein [Virgibacillus ndiopensis]|uniref:plasmid pRiA4b ORF-3 family protein n=1 Tax=Virgibacillus ndiopensis TaxID=2004408 RepID=UPI001C3F4727|nr:plasmid pRiA4b ORF-3 family protein [Virgibacillus ndiopensis]
MKAYQIEVELADTDPLIYRRVIMPTDATFKKLHDVIQTVTNFRGGYPSDFYHFYDFDLSAENIRVTMMKKHTRITSISRKIETKLWNK